MVMNLLRKIFSLCQIYTGGKDAVGQIFVCLNLARTTMQISLLHDGQNSERKYSSEAKWTGNIAAEEHELEPVLSC